MRRSFVECLIAVTLQVWLQERVQWRKIAKGNEKKSPKHVNRREKVYQSRQNHIVFLSWPTIFFFKKSWYQKRKKEKHFSKERIEFNVTHEVIGRKSVMANSCGINIPREKNATVSLKWAKAWFIKNMLICPLVLTFYIFRFPFYFRILFYVNGEFFTFFLHYQFHQKWI